MLRTFQYVLPFPVSVNVYWRRHGHTIHISPRGKRFRDDVVGVVKKVAYTNKELKVEIGYWRPDQRVRDIDNYQKGLFDALKAARVYRDDCQIVDMHVKWLGFDPMKVGSTHITIEELP